MGKLRCVDFGMLLVNERFVGNIRWASHSLEEPLGKRLRSSRAGGVEKDHFMVRIERTEPLGVFAQLGLVFVSIVFTAWVFGACGGTVHNSTGPWDAAPDGGTVDGTVEVDARPAVCGDGVLEKGEACDTAIVEGQEGACPIVCESDDPCVTTLLVGHDCQTHCLLEKISNFIDNDGCCPTGGNAVVDRDCEPLCGNMVTEEGELCDGDCPTGCNDGDACTSDSMVGAAATCDATCVHEPVVDCISGDGCCPEDCDALTDSDCGVVCGNGVLESGETCDPPSSCPNTCDDGETCTSDVMTGSPATCDVSCSHQTITECVSGDGCCPAGCDQTSDADCGAVCDNGVLESGETCDPISSCPTDCDDNDVCTTDIMNGSPSTCNVVCGNQPITNCGGAEGCCPSDCNANNDPDCSPECGNGVVESGEECDDGNTVSGDGCDSTCHTEVPTYTAFRVDWMALRDPHMYVRVLFSCYDVTDDGPFGSDSVNDQLNASIQGDDDSDGWLDLSLVLVMRPLDQSATYSGPSDFYSALCTVPMDGTVCHEDPNNPGESTTYANQGSGTCLEPYAGTTSGYSPAVVSTTAPPVCFDTGHLEIRLVLSGTTVVLHDSEIAAVYDADPATGLISGLVRGFISEAEAQNIDVDLGSLGTQPLSSLLQPDACGDGDDRDVGLDGSTVGWWFYLNFTGVVVDWTDQ